MSVDETNYLPDYNVLDILLSSNKKDKYKTETYRIDKVKYEYLQNLINPSLKNKLNSSDIYTIDMINKLLKRKITSEEIGLIDYLKQRDIFNRNQSDILLLETILKNKNIKPEELSTYTIPKSKLLNVPTLSIKKISTTETFENVKIISESSSSEDSENSSVESLQDSNYLLISTTFKNLGIISKDQRTNILNPSFYKYFEVKKAVGQNSVQHENINWNNFFPGKSNGKIVRFLKIYKEIPNKPKDYTREVFKKELIDSGFVECKNEKLYYTNLDEFKEWIKNKLN